MNAVKPLTIVAAGALMLACGAAQADKGPGFYAGVGYSHMTLETDGADFLLPTTTFHVGVELSPNLQLEARYGINAGDDEQSYQLSEYPLYMNVHETIETTAYWAVLAKIQVPVTTTFSVYGMIGMNHLAVENSGTYEILSVFDNYYDYGTLSGESEETSTTYGIGAQLKLGESFALAGEYQRMFKDVSGFNVGLSYRF